MTTRKTDKLFEKTYTNILNQIGDKLDREAGLPIPSDAPRLTELLLLNVENRVRIMDIVNDIHNDRYHQRGIFRRRTYKK